MIKLYNTLSLKKQSFKPLHGKLVKIYTCGPTVYDFAHIGNLRTYIFEDILRRMLKYNNYKIKQVMNITDVEDKIIKKAQQEKKDIYAITKPYTKIFLDDLKKLNIEKVEFYPKATEHIKEMIALIKKMLTKKFAYQGEDGSVYFNISKFKNYGKLSQLEKREIKIGARINADEYKKENAQDFVLWKTTLDKTGLREIKAEWQSPWGWGRPGWHIECSAMAMKYLGETLDIHAGAVDLIFPHHENEIAQSEAATGKKFAKYWLHGEHLLVDNQKMSKSLGNIFTLRDTEKRNFNPLAFRYLILTTHYRSKLNFSWKSLKAAQNGLDRLYKIASALTAPRHDKEITFFSARNDKKIQKYKKEFLAAINDDLNIPKALSIVWQIISAKGGFASDEKYSGISSATKKQMLLEFDKVLGLGLTKIKPFSPKMNQIPQKIRQMADQREKLRVNKQFIQADTLRKQIKELGYKIEDTAFGFKIRKQV